MIVNKLQIIFKSAERCNLACPYCYYFYSGDESYKSRPAVTNRRVVDETIRFIANGISDLGIQVVDFVFHGGEPTLQKPAEFDYACTAVRAALQGKCRLRFAIQTNGTRLTDQWTDLFSKHAVVVGVSMDGDKVSHDENRVFHNGRGSYDVIRKGLSRYSDRHPDEYVKRPGFSGGSYL